MPHLLARAAGAAAAGRVENGRVGVFLGYASARGRFPPGPEGVADFACGGPPPTAREGRVRGAGKGVAKLIPRAVPEVRGMLLRVVWDRRTPAEQALAWSERRRRPQHRARRSHDRSRGAGAPN